MLFRSPGSSRISKVLASLNRVVEENEYFGWSTVLLYGEAGEEPAAAP